LFWQIVPPISALSDDAIDEVLYGSDERIKIKSSLIGTSSDYFVTYEGVVKYIIVDAEMQSFLIQASPFTFRTNRCFGKLFRPFLR